MMIIIGVDPGLSGAITVAEAPTAEIIEIIDMPTMRPTKRQIVDEIELNRQLSRFDIDYAFIESITVRPMEGAMGALAYGRGYGVLRGILRCRLIPIYDVAPVVWKRAMGIPAGSDKDASRSIAKEIFQSGADLFARKKDHGRAESALIMLYGIEQVLQAITTKLHRRRK